MGDYLKTQKKYVSSAFILLLTSVIVKIIGAVYKIPLTAFIGAVGRGYFAAAYNIYLPLHAVLMGALPVSLSRLVSKYNALGDKRMLSSLRKGSRFVFFAAGMLGVCVIVVAAVPYSMYIAHAPKSVYTVFVIAPSLLFSCLSASLRGYFEGYMNMKPTAVSQTLEALVKTVFGLLFSKYTMYRLFGEYSAVGTVFRIPFKNESDALSFIYPLTSAAAMLGVTLGALEGYVYVVIYYMINRDKLFPTQREETEGASFSLFHFR
ncbi:MAG: oligosaccharide flippase family protein [Eubacterium sp.]|nr:oligosaccharide flippase family protein [Eubacterium sp.]